LYDLMNVGLAKSSLDKAKEAVVVWLRDDPCAQRLTEAEVAFLRKCHRKTKCHNSNSFAAASSRIREWHPFNPENCGGAGRVCAVVSDRYDHMAAPRLPSGKILVAAGYSGVLELSSAELYDPDTGLWAPTGALVMPHRGHSVTVLPSGQVLVAGGIPADHGPAVPSAELYDPGTGIWTMTSSMMTARFIHRTILLTSGQVLVVGGRDRDAVDGVALSSAELYF
jgi:hypothetical protein